MKKKIKHSIKFYNNSVKANSSRTSEFKFKKNNFFPIFKDNSIAVSNQKKDSVTSFNLMEKSKKELFKERLYWKRLKIAMPFNETLKTFYFSHYKKKYVYSYTGNSYLSTTRKKLMSETPLAAYLNYDFDQTIQKAIRIQQKTGNYDAVVVDEKNKNCSWLYKQRTDRKTRRVIIFRREEKFPKYMRYNIELLDIRSHRTIRLGTRMSKKNIRFYGRYCWWLYYLKKYTKWYRKTTNLGLFKRYLWVDRMARRRWRKERKMPILTLKEQKKKDEKKNWNKSYKKKKFLESIYSSPEKKPKPYHRLNRLAMERSDWSTQFWYLIDWDLEQERKYRCRLRRGWIQLKAVIETTLRSAKVDFRTGTITYFKEKRYTTHLRPLVKVKTKKNASLHFGIRFFCRWIKGQKLFPKLSNTYLNINSKF